MAAKHFEVVIPVSGELTVHVYSEENLTKRYAQYLAQLLVGHASVHGGLLNPLSFDWSDFTVESDGKKSLKITDARVDKLKIIK